MSRICRSDWLSLAPGMAANSFKPSRLATAVPLRVMPFALLLIPHSHICGFFVFPGIECTAVLFIPFPMRDTGEYFCFYVHVSLVFITPVNERNSRIHINPLLTLCQQGVFYWGQRINFLAQRAFYNLRRKKGIVLGFQPMSLLFTIQFMSSSPVVTVYFLSQEPSRSMHTWDFPGASRRCHKAGPPEAYISAEPIWFHRRAIQINET